MTAEEVINQNTTEHLMDNSAYEEIAKAVNPYGDGYAARRITDAVLYYYGMIEKRPEGYKHS